HPARAIRLSPPVECPAPFRRDTRRRKARRGKVSAISPGRRRSTALSLALTKAKLWSAVARYRFGSHLRILQTSGTIGPQWVPFHHCHSIEMDYQSGTELPHSKGCRPL